MNVNWTGVFPAVTTKLDDKGGIDVKANHSSIERLIDNGVSGIIVLPMLGENASLSLSERETVIRAAAEVVKGRVPLLSGIAETSQAAAVENGRSYLSWGAEGFMVFPNIGYKTDPRETVAWYKAIAGGTNAPIMIYNNPIAYGVDVTPEILQDLATTEEIVCVKEETGDIRRVTDLYNALGDRFEIFCGIDDLILESVALGVTGWVSGMTNAWTKECVGLYNLCQAGRFEEARKLYRILTPAFHLDTDVKLVQYIKLAEHLVYGANPAVRVPRLPLTQSEHVEASAIITKAMRDLETFGPLPA